MENDLIKAKEDFLNSGHEYGIFWHVIDDENVKVTCLVCDTEELFTGPDARKFTGPGVEQAFPTYDCSHCEDIVEEFLRTV